MVEHPLKLDWSTGGDCPVVNVPNLGELRLRPPRVMMDLSQLSTIKAHRLSFCRTLIRRMTLERWKIVCNRFNLNDRGIGTVVYGVDANGYQLYFLVFSDEVPQVRRTGRLSEARFDGMGVLCHGPLNDDRIEQEFAELQKRSAGRTDCQTLGWTLTTRSASTLELVVRCLADGRQPTRNDLLVSSRYLFRNNGYYGNGRHGSRMWSSLQPDHPLSHPYHPEMFALYMWRHFGFDLAEHLARVRSPRAVELDTTIKRYIGVGNSTGQGMSTFVIKWPRWMHAWNLIRETATSITLAQPANAEVAMSTHRLLRRCRNHYAEAPVTDDDFFLSPREIANDLDRAENHLHRFRLTPEDSTWSEFASWSQNNLNTESAELVRSLLTEVYGAQIDPLDEVYAREMRRRATLSPTCEFANCGISFAMRMIGCLPTTLTILTRQSTSFTVLRSTENNAWAIGPSTLDRSLRRLRPWSLPFSNWKRTWLHHHREIQQPASYWITRNTGSLSSARKPSMSYLTPNFAPTSLGPASHRPMPSGLSSRHSAWRIL